MRSSNFKFYLFMAAVIFFVILPIVKSGLQEMSLGQDLRRIQYEYSMAGPVAFRARLDELVRRAPLDPKEVKISMRENEREAKVLIEIEYPSRMEIFFYPVERQVVVREEIPLVPL